MSPDIDIETVPSDADAGLEYAELYALWKADEDAYNEGLHISDAEYLLWMARVRMHLTADEKVVFDEASRDNTVDEFRAEKSAALAKILWTRHDLHADKLSGRLRYAS
jgi:hypothetical protein